MCLAQTRWYEKGFAIRDADSTTYTGAIESAPEFGQRIYREAPQRGWSRAKKKSIMAEGIMNYKGRPQFTASSAGSHPAGNVRPEALRELHIANIPTTGLRSQSSTASTNLPAKAPAWLDFSRVEGHS